MKTLKIRLAIANNRRKCLVIETSRGMLTLPYSQLKYPPIKNNRIVEIYPDKEIQREGITYVLEDGTEETIHVDIFLNYNKDPDYMRELALYDLTVKLQKQKKKLGISVSELARKLNTSRSQIDRLLDQTNYNKSIDSMLALACVLGLEIEIKLAA